MNPQEQQNHKTITRALQQQINDLVAIVSALEAQQATIYGEAVEAMAKERLARQTMGDKLRESIGEEQKQRLAIIADRDRRIAAFASMPFYHRLRWLLTGR